MAKLPVVSSREVVKAFGKVGYAFDHQRGSHIVLRQVAQPFRRVTVPDHDPIAKGTLRAILRQTGLTIEEFGKLL